MSYALLEKTVLKYGDPESFGALVTQIRAVGRDIEHLQVVRSKVENEIKAKNEFQDIQFTGKCHTCRAVGHQAMWCPKRATKEPCAWQV